MNSPARSRAGSRSLVARSLGRPRGATACARQATAQPGTLFRPLGARLLADCLNEHRAERLSPDHVLMLARMGKDHGCHAILHYQCQELGYTVPTPVEPRDEAAELQRQYIEATRALLKMSERIERLRSVA